MSTIKTRVIRLEKQISYLSADKPQQRGPVLYDAALPDEELQAFYALHSGQKHRAVVFLPRVEEE